MTPIVDRLEEQYGEQLAVRRVNAAVGDGPTIMQAYRIPGHPTLLFFDTHGQEAARLVGPQAAGIVEDSLKAILPVASQN